MLLRWGSIGSHEGYIVVEAHKYINEHEGRELSISDPPNQHFDRQQEYDMVLMNSKFIFMVVVVGLALSEGSPGKSLAIKKQSSNRVMCTRPGDEICPYTRPAITFSTCGIHAQGESCTTFCMALIARSLNVTCYEKPPSQYLYLQFYDECKERCEDKSMKIATGVRKIRIGGPMTQAAQSCNLCVDCNKYFCTPDCIRRCPRLSRGAPRRIH